jgi:hypothetical protein
MENEWESKKKAFEVVDVRQLKGNFLPMVLKKSEKLPVGDGICVIQSFEPIPLYSALGNMGFIHVTEKISDGEYRVYFYKTEARKPALDLGETAPLKPMAIVNIAEIDSNLADIVVNFWEHVWQRENPGIEQKYYLLLSLTMAVGAGRYRQATRELVKAYALGVSVGELDEVFSLIIWNQSVATFASEIGPSPLFKAYRLVKESEKKALSREEIVKKLVEKFGEKNPEVSTV